MIDKEQKKWVTEKWGENEEPEETPTERPHAVSKNKEQIIVDSINLSDIRSRLEHGQRMSISTKEFEQIIDLLEEKMQECEELKKRATIAEDNFACEVQARLYHQNEWLKFSKENDRYRKALEEIEEYCNDYCMDDCIGDERLRTFDKCQQCISGDILDIINKAKGNN